MRFPSVAVIYDWCKTSCVDSANVGGLCGQQRSSFSCNASAFHAVHAALLRGGAPHCWDDSRAQGSLECRRTTVWVVG
jgi:hypothetical protein